MRNVIAIEIGGKLDRSKVMRWKPLGLTATWSMSDRMLARVILTWIEGQRRTEISSTTDVGRASGARRDAYGVG